jgi:prepilin-type processing-associated H-X9-DG protein
MSNGEKKFVAGHGTIEGGQLRLALPMSDGPMINKQASIKSDSSIPAADETEPAAPDIAPAQVPAGESPQIEEVSAAKVGEEAKDEDAPSSTQELVCRGTLSDGDSMMLSCKVEGGTKKPPFTQDSEFTRLTERDVAELKIMAQRIHEMEILATALKAFQSTNDSTYPEELSALNDGYLELPQLTMSGGSRIIEYHPDGPAVSVPVRSESMPEREFLFQWEEEVRAAWPEFPGIPPMVLIRYSAPPMVLQFSDADPHTVERVDPDNRLRCSSSPPPLLSPEIHAKLIDSCQNNMKQLGLVMRMYSNDSRERRNPAGWTMLYPEYIRALDILTCPSLFEGHAGHTLSYDLLFPTMNEAELVILAEEMGLDTGDIKALKHKVPAIIENHPCADGKSRNVVFWDGHAERIEESDWARVVAPFVSASEAYRTEVFSNEEAVTGG